MSENEDKAKELTAEAKQELAQQVIEQAAKFGESYSQEDWETMIQSVSDNLPRFTALLGKTPYIDVLLTVTWIASSIIIQRPGLSEEFFKILTHFGESQAKTLQQLAEANPALVQEARDKDTPIVIVPSLPRHVNLLEHVDGDSSNLVN